MLNFPEDERLINNKELEWFQKMQSEERVKFSANNNFFTKADSTEPEQAGIWGAFMGSFFTLFVTLILSFPLAVATANGNERIRVTNSVKKEPMNAPQIPACSGSVESALVKKLLLALNFTLSSDCIF